MDNIDELYLINSFGQPATNSLAIYSQLALYLINLFGQSATAPHPLRALSALLSVRCQPSSPCAVSNPLRALSATLSVHCQPPSPWTPLRTLTSPKKSTKKRHERWQNKSFKQFILDFLYFFLFSLDKSIRRAYNGLRRQ